MANLEDLTKVWLKLRYGEHGDDVIAVLETHCQPESIIRLNAAPCDGVVAQAISWMPASYHARQQQEWVASLVAIHE